MPRFRCLAPLAVTAAVAPWLQAQVPVRDAAELLKACPQVQLLLNGVKFSASGRRFGSYYGREG